MTSAEPVPVAGDVIAQKYRVERLLGEGGMGTVLEAVHLFTGKKVAIKWMLPALSAEPQACARFLREAQIAGRLEHPSIVDVYDVGRERGSMYLVMELLHGETLADRLERDGPLTAPDAIRLLMPVLRAVSAAHAAGVLHRDLKPENVFLCRDQAGGALDPKVLDFGVSKLLDAPDSLKLTRTGTVVGTMFYMAPEQIAAAPVGPPADVFALGVILYQCLTGAMPYEATNFNALVVEMATKPAISLRDRDPSVDVALDAVVLRALERDVEQRYPDVASFARALAALAPGTRFELPKETFRHVPPSAAASAPQVPRVASSELTSKLPRGVSAELTAPSRPAIRSTASVFLRLGVAVALLGTAAAAMAWLFYSRRATTERVTSSATVERPVERSTRTESDVARNDGPRAISPERATPQTRVPAVVPEPAPPGPTTEPVAADERARSQAVRRARRSGENAPDVRRSPRSSKIRMEDF